MKNEFIDSWKNKIVFEKQLELNKKELESYPPHWVGFVSICNKILENNKQINLLDIGCGCGSYYKICKDNFKDKIKYFGIDYSQEAIEICKKEWDCSSFECKDFFNLNSEYIKHYDAIHLGALLDVLPNGDKALEFILNLKPKYVILGRMDIIEGESKNYTYKAYGEIETYKYLHNKEIVKKIFDTFKYDLIFGYRNNYLIKNRN